MKNMILVLAMTIGLTSSVFAGEIGHGNTSQPILSALANPSNLSGEMLNSAVKSAAEKGLTIDLDTMQITDLGQDHYQVLFYLTQDDNTEKASVSAEIQVRNGQAYVFNFNVERIVPVQPFPGVSLGNR